MDKIMQSDISKNEETVVLSKYEKEILDNRLKALEQYPDNLVTWDEIKNTVKKNMN